MEVTVPGRGLRVFSLGVLSGVWTAGLRFAFHCGSCVWRHFPGSLFLAFRAKHFKGAMLHHPLGAGVSRLYRESLWSAPSGVYRALKARAHPQLTVAASTCGGWAGGPGQDSVAVTAIGRHPLPNTAKEGAGSGNCLEFQGLGLYAFTAVARVQSLLGDLRSPRPCGVARNTEKKKNRWVGGGGEVDPRYQE